MKVSEVLWIREDIDWDRRVVGFWHHPQTRVFVDSRGEHGGTVGEHPEQFGLDAHDPLVRRAKKIGGFDELFAMMAERGWVRGNYINYSVNGRMRSELSLQCQDARTARRTARAVARLAPFSTMALDFTSRTDNTAPNLRLDENETRLFLTSGRLPDQPS